MLAVLSPSKTLDFDDDLSCTEFSQPSLLTESKKLLSELKKMSETKLAKALSVSPKLAALNHERYQSFKFPFSKKNARQALLAFRGDVYHGFELGDYRKTDWNYAQKHLRILSGLYGVLRPLDLMQAYRLEMKTKLKNPRGSDLYQFWGERIAIKLRDELPKKNCPLINLASQEYFKAIDKSTLDTDIIDIDFKQKKGKQLKTVALFAKQARGIMANFIIRQRLKDVSGLRDFSEDGYRFDSSLSDDQKLVFTRAA